MNIVHVLIGFGGGGVENFVLNLSKKHIEEGIPVTAVSVTHHDIRRKEFEETGIRCFSLNVNSVTTLLKGIETLYTIVKKSPGAVMHAHGFHALMICCVVRLVLIRTNLVFTLHTNFIRSFTRRLLLFGTRWLRNADIIFSADSKKWYHRSNAMVIQNGVDIRKYALQLQKEPVFTFLFLGRLEEPKNPLYLVELAKLLKGEDEFKIEIAGYGSQQQELEKMIAQYKLGDRIDVMGFREDTPELIAKAHCVIVPSRWEGMPIVVLEAGAAGVPIISTPVGSIPVILNKQNSSIGELEEFPAMAKEMLHNYPDAITRAKRLQKLIQQKFSIESSARQHLELYFKFNNN